MHELSASTVLNKWIDYLSNHPSYEFLSKHPETAFESWFRLEFARMWSQNNFTIFFDCNYQNASTKKADIKISEETGGTCIFELKCLVYNRESNKQQSIPNQINLLENELQCNKASVGYLISLQNFTKRTLNNRINTLNDKFKDWSILRSEPKSITWFFALKHP